MPLIWTAPEVFMEHAGIRIYRAYKNQALNNPMFNLYSLDSSEEKDCVDVSDLPNPNNHNLNTHEGIKLVLAEALDNHLLDDYIGDQEPMPDPHWNSLENANWEEFVKQERSLVDHRDFGDPIPAGHLNGLIDFIGAISEEALKKGILVYCGVSIDRLVRRISEGKF